MCRTFNNYKRRSMLLILVKWAVVFAVIAFVYREILSREKILNWWFKFGLRFEKRFFYRPIWGCEKCFAGQLAFWTFFLNWLSTNFDTNAPFWRFIFFFIPKYGKNDFNVFVGLFSVSLTIFITFLISKTIKKLNYE